LLCSFEVGRGIRLVWTCACFSSLGGSGFLVSLVPCLFPGLFVVLIAGLECGRYGKGRYFLRDFSMCGREVRD
jgi:hypothetical protein